MKTINEYPIGQKFRSVGVKYELEYLGELIYGSTTHCVFRGNNLLTSKSKSTINQWLKDGTLKPI